ncbi:Mor transcription activator family protein [Cupriavidus necator]|uniref:Mor transcription activator family protein n=1 Tax=Cupriavidus necator TaxID=106590 RepID=UPI0005B53EE9|nr:Mor transcription activator family protein [Cupriavidus necator]
MTDPLKNEDASQSDAAIDLTGALTTIVREEITPLEHLARPIIEGLERGLRRLLGGQEVYIPAPDRRERDEAIRAAFNGRNRDEVCRQFGISKTTFYEVINRT